MPGPLLYAVHVNGSLITAELLRSHGYESQLHRLPQGNTDAEFTDSAAAISLAEYLRENFPEDVVSIVLWRDDEAPAPVSADRIERDDRTDYAFAQDRTTHRAGQGMDSDDVPAPVDL